MTALGLANRIADALGDAGVRATLEPRNLNPPGALIVPRRVERQTARRSLGTVDVILWAPASVSRYALTHLDTLAGAAGAALDAAGIPWSAGEWLARPNPSTGEDQLTYTLTVTTSQETTA
jgi:hypothetical protein